MDDRAAPHKPPAPVRSQPLTHVSSVPTRASTAPATTASDSASPTADPPAAAPPPQSNSTPTARKQHHLPSLHGHRTHHHHHSHERSSASGHQHTHHHRHPHHYARDTIHSAVALHAPASLQELVKGVSGSGNWERGASRLGNGTGSLEDPGPDAAHSRKGSVADGGGSGGDPDAAFLALAGAGKKRRKRLSAKERRRRAALRDTDLRTALHTLTSLSLTATRHLDDEHYALLEQLAAQSRAVAQLAELAEQRGRARASLAADAAALDAETRAQADGLDALVARAGRRVDGLQGRLREARGRVEELRARLEEAGRRVEEREWAEEAGQRRVTWWLRVLWGILSGAGLVVAVVAVLPYFRAEPGEVASGAPSLLGNESVLDPMRRWALDGIAGTGDGAGRAGSYEERAGTMEEAGKEEVDPRLKMLDEL